MTAASADRLQRTSDGDLLTYVAAATIYAGTLVGVNVGGTNSGKISPMANTNLLYFTGVAVRGAAATETVRVMKVGCFEFEFDGTAVAAYIGQKVYAVDDQTVGLGNTANTTLAKLVGVITEIVSTSKVRVRINDAVDLIPEILTFPMAAGVTITRGDLVMFSSTGYALTCADTASTKFAGFAVDTVVNSGADGAASVRVIQEDTLLLATTQAVGTYLPGDPVYMDANKVDTAAGTANVDGFVGRVVRTGTVATTAIVKMMALGEASTG